ncbi:MAG: response regulator [Anaerohalosphaeraceae bacterium]|nr:response regulator [Anaerohalosphaeraceae bacterium]
MDKRKVVVADDEVHIVQVVAMKLRNNGFDVVTAEDGAQAYELCLSEKPDILITDYQMPQMTGIELIEKIRQDEQFTSMPIIMLTARGFAIDDQLQGKLNISRCLSKPFSPKELLGHVEDVVSQPVSK